MRGKILLLSALLCSTVNAGWHEYAKTNDVVISYNDGVSTGPGTKAFSYRVVSGNTANIFDAVANCDYGTVLGTGGRFIGSDGTVTPTRALTSNRPQVVKPDSILYGIMQRVCS